MYVTSINANISYHQYYRGAIHQSYQGRLILAKGSSTMINEHLRSTLSHYITIRICNHRIFQLIRITKWHQEGLCRQLMTTKWIQSSGNPPLIPTNNHRAHAPKTEDLAKLKSNMMCGGMPMFDSTINNVSLIFRNCVPPKSVILNDDHDILSIGYSA